MKLTLNVLINYMTYNAKMQKWNLQSPATLKMYATGRK